MARIIARQLFYTESIEIYSTINQTLPLASVYYSNSIRIDSFALQAEDFIALSIPTFNDARQTKIN